MAAPSGRERPDRRQSPPSITPRDCRTTTIRRLVSVAPHPPPALSLRPILAIFGLVVCTVAAVATGFITHAAFFTVVLAVLAVIAAVDIAVIVRRKRRGEPG
jgi:hypothetical protein